MQLTENFNFPGKSSTNDLEFDEGQSFTNTSDIANE